ncbi:MAG: sodium:calcium antiporter [Candidatus Aquicultorales bacterium]
MSFLVFIISAIVIGIAGTYLAKYGDAIADETGLSGVWIGAVLLAIATSLPEIASDVTAGLYNTPDLAAGDIFGSGMANMLLLAVVSFYYGRLYKGTLLQDVTLAHSATAALAMLLTALAGFFIVIRSRLAIYEIGVDSAVLFVVYIVAMWALGEQASRERLEPEKPEEPEARPTLGQAVLGFAISTLAIVAAAPFLVTSANAIVETTGISSSFMGTLFLALVTSAPELAVSLSAIRIGAFDLAVGDLFGSNAFNIVILFFTDIAYRQGPLLSSVAPAHLASAFLLIVLMSIGLAGLVFRAKKKFLLIVPDAVLIILVYAIGLWMIFSISK